MSFPIYTERVSVLELEGQVIKYLITSFLTKAKLLKKGFNENLSTTKLLLYPV